MPQITDVGATVRKDIKGIEIFLEPGYPTDSQLIPEISEGYPESRF